MPDRAGQRAAGGRSDRRYARNDVCRRSRCCREPLEGGRRGDGGDDEGVLPRHAARRIASTGSVAAGANRDAQSEALAFTVLLGCVYHAGRVPVIALLRFTVVAAIFVVLSTEILSAFH